MRGATATPPRRRFRSARHVCAARSTGSDGPTARPPWSLPCFVAVMASSSALRLLAFVTLILGARSATAAGPLVRVDATPRPNGLPSERVLTVDHDALVALRARTTATLDDFPLGGDGPATLELTRIRPFDEHTRFEEVTDT